MQQLNNGETSDQLWFTLRRALSLMVCNHWSQNSVDADYFRQDRPDLAEMAKPENKPDLDIFRSEGFDFWIPTQEHLRVFQVFQSARRLVNSDEHIYRYVFCSSMHEFHICSTNSEIAIFPLWVANTVVRSHGFVQLYDFSNQGCWSSLPEHRNFCKINFKYCISLSYRTFGGDDGLIMPTRLKISGDAWDSRDYTD